MRGDSVGLAANGHGSGGTVREKRVGYDLVGVPTVLVMQAAKFQGTEQNTGRRTRVKKGTRPAAGRSVHPGNP